MFSNDDKEEDHDQNTIHQIDMFDDSLDISGQHEEEGEKNVGEPKVA